MTAAPLTVVIPTFRDGNALARALSSVENQTRPPAEIIVVDDASSDDTCAKILPAFAHLPIKLLTLTQNLGPGGARNVGIAAGCQPYIGFLDADDEWHPEKIELQMRLMQAPQQPALTAHLKSFSGKQWPVLTTVSVSGFSRTEILLKNPASISTVFIRRDAIRFMFPEWYAGEDYAFVAANLLTGISGSKINLVLARAHKAAFGASGLSSKMLDMQLGEIRTHQLLRQKGLIRTPQYYVLVVWTVMKFMRRLALQCLRRLRSDY